MAHGSFSGAAERLGVAKSSVSRRVASLEARLGARLLQRSTRRMALTEVGQRYHQRVARALDSLRDAEDSVREVQDEPQGELKITAPVDVGGLLGTMLAEFSEAYPKVDCSISLTQRRVDMVREGFDMAIRAGDLQDSTLIVRKLVGGEMVVFGAPKFFETHGSPGSIDEAAKLPWVLFRGHGGEQTLEWPGSDSGPLVVRGRISGDEFGFVRAAVIAGAGLGYAPRFVVEEDFREGRLVRLCAELPAIRTSLALVYPSRQFVPAKVRAFQEFAVPWFANNLSGDPT